MMKFINNAHLKLCFLLLPVAFCISGCDDGPTLTCCEYFARSDAYISAIGDPDLGARELIYIYASSVRSFAKQKDKSDAEYLGAGEYLCSIMPEMKGINYDYLANNDKDAQSVCSASIPKHAAMANKIKEAWDNCCYVMGQHVLEHQESECRKIDQDANPEAYSICMKEFETKEFTYLSCFRTYLTTGNCEYIIN